MKLPLVTRHDGKADLISENGGVAKLLCFCPGLFEGNLNFDIRGLYENQSIVGHDCRAFICLRACSRSHGMLFRENPRRCGFEYRQSGV
jgi:hypothetical protein